MNKRPPRLLIDSRLLPNLSQSVKFDPYDFRAIEAEEISVSARIRVSEGVKSGHYVYLVEKGRLRTCVGDASQIVRSGQVAWLGAGLGRDLLAEAGSRWIVLRVRNRCFSLSNPGDRTAWECVVRLGVFSRHFPRLPLTPVTVDELFRLGRNMVGLYRRGGTSSIPLMKAGILQFLATAWDDARLGRKLQGIRLGALDSGTLQRALLLIEQEGSAIRSITALAGRLGVSKSSLYRIFATAGLPGPAQLLGRARIEEASHFLLQTERTVLDIALATGFNSLSSFYRAFHRIHGIAPGQWRKCVV